MGCSARGKRADGRDKYSAPTGGTEIISAPKKIRQITFRLAYRTYLFFRCTPKESEDEGRQKEQ